MKTFLTLMQREWLQHRFGWALLAGIPLGLALLMLSFGQIEISDDKLERVGTALPAMVTMVSIAATPAVLFVIFGLTSLILVAGMARRDHQDRSIEFWLSLPTGHVSSLATPLLTHLLLVPAAALLLGVAGGWLVSMVLVTRLAGFSAWLSLPWADVAAAALAMLLRLLAGLPLALLWASPLILAQVMCNAWFKRWGLPVLLLSFALGGYLVDRWLGQGYVAYLLTDILRHAGQALVATGEYHIRQATPSPEGVYDSLRQVPGWALRDLGGAVRALASPLFAGCVACGAALFALLVDWRRRGASAAG
jgi:hypothetical protein